MTTSTNHLDYADAAEAAERGNAWAQASALWQMAIDLCDDPDRQATYRDGIARCDAAAAVDRELASIAKRILQIPTLETRKADHLDFHETMEAYFDAKASLFDGLDAAGAQFAPGPPAHREPAFAQRHERPKLLKKGSTRSPSRGSSSGSSFRAG